MRDRLSDSESVSSAYIAALVGRAVAIELYNVHKVLSLILYLKQKRLEFWLNT